MAFKISFMGAALALTLLSAPALAASSAVAVMYHRFGEDKYPSTNIRIEQFEAHIKELQTGGYQVLPLGEIVSALQEGRALPDKAVAITIDDAYLSVYQDGFPRLKAAGFPFTLFVNPAPIDEGLAGYMTWDQVRELRDAGATIGNHTDRHVHMADESPATNQAEIAQAAKRLTKELGQTPTLFAYPYGEASTEALQVVAKAGFVAAFGQHSGAMGSDSDQLYLPRYSLNENYGKMDRFKTAINSLALPVTDISPPNIKLEKNPPAYGFTVKASVGSLAGLTCYASHLGQVEPVLMGRRVEVRFDKPFPEGRGRINCTLPAGQGRFYWFGNQFVVRN